VATLDFTSERKTMSSVYKGIVGKDQNSLLIKGAPERVIEKCVSYKKSDGSEAQFSADEKKKLIDLI
jgi:magnesium-transporting ATPase (P-type)